MSTSVTMKYPRIVTVRVFGKIIMARKVHPEGVADVGHKTGIFPAPYRARMMGVDIYTNCGMYENVINGKYYAPCL